MSAWLWFWIALAVVFGIGEILTRGLYLVPFAAAAAIAGGLAFVGRSVPMQWGVYAISAVILLFVTNRISRKLAD